jgi:RNA polymerase sigma-70 factor (ECF subfamily)
VSASLPAKDSPEALAQVVEQAQGGGASAQRWLFERFQRPVLAFCLVATRRNPEQAKDLLQEAFLKAFRSIGSLRDPERFEGWLFAITANVCRDRLKAEARKRLLLEQLTLEVEDPTPYPPGDDVRLGLIQRIISEIADPTLREIVQLRYSEPGLSTPRIADRLGIPLGTVTVKLVRFRAAVKRELVRTVLGDDALPLEVRP